MFKTLKVVKLKDIKCQNMMHVIDMLGNFDQFSRGFGNNVFSLESDPQIWAKW